MTRLGRKVWLMALAVMPVLSSVGQTQSCPVNISFSTGTLTHWQAYTGNNMGGNGPNAIKMVYDSGGAAPNGTIDAISFSEYNLGRVDGIRVITGQGTDPFGSFPTIPTINGYAYHYSILLGSTSVSQRAAIDPNTGAPTTPAGPQGGYIRGVSYLINVPPGSPTTPYTITYAYAMVLENGTHPSEQQPMARAIVSTPAGVIDCASPTYFLPTNGGLDSATARANGFSPSPVPTPNESRNPGNAGVYLQDVWTKGWTEVNFDLSAYRGQQVSLTFEADNCVPGGHFAYAYFALRDVCAGLHISGDTLACTNSVVKYSIPSLSDATYDWSVPDGWTLASDGNNNQVSVTIGPKDGWIVAREKNSCTSLVDSLFIHLYKGALPQARIAPRDTTLCYGGSALLQALITTGTEYTWGSPELFTGKNKGTIPAVPFTTNVTAIPRQTADYILSIRNEGCPIPVYDTFSVTVVPPIRVNPGHDTLVVIGQPLQFHATSSDLYKDTYQWTPRTYLTDPTIADPIGQYGLGINSMTYRVTATDSFGCYGSDTIHVTIAPTLPDIFVPSAFTPGKASNSIFRPVCMGVSTLEYFRIYNRMGQLLYSTSQIGQGWDGRVHGSLAESNVYVWVARGTDYAGRAITKKGTVLLIR